MMPVLDYTIYGWDGAFDIVYEKMHLSTCGLIGVPIQYNYYTSAFKEYWGKPELIIL